jgi:molybdopterin-biosynthesis enzyme MoeA-like protein
VAAFSAAYDVVFTSGGVGPTHDDMTMDGVAAAFGRPVVEHPGLRAAIERHVRNRANAALLKLAMVPEGADLLVDDQQAFPTVVVGNVYVLPGIPELFQSKVVALRDRFRARPYFLRQVYVRENETRIAEFLDATLAAFPALLLGSYPKLAEAEYRVLLTLESKDEAYVDRALDDLVGRMPDGFVFRVDGRGPA